jgi:regulator of sirC expression with transglutaminase-like and TPR domain
VGEEDRAHPPAAQLALDPVTIADAERGGLQVLGRVTFSDVDASSMRRFAREVQRPEPEIELDRAALLLGEWEDGPVDVDGYRTALDEFAAAALALRGGLSGSFAGPRAISRVLFGDLGFRGNSNDYYDPRNSFLHAVIDRRIGIPISLSVVYLEVARRIGVRVVGIGFPGHFLVRAFEGDRAVVIDPFNGGGVLDKDDLRDLLGRTAGPEAELRPAHLAPTGKVAILTRMLVNLAGIYGKRGDLFRSLEVLERLHLLDPDNGRIAGEVEQLRRRCEGLN